MSQPRLITDHVLNGLNECIMIEAMDEPGVGGANHVYRLTLTSPAGGPPVRQIEINFQNGAINVAGHNAFSIEALQAINIDRMRGFQFQRNPDGSYDYTKPGKYASHENQMALDHMEAALMWLQKRTRARVARGVEGTHKV
jgi:hypothetical protein